MEHFVTNFNLRFLPQGLALYQSMRRHLEEFVLWVVCMDAECFHVLLKLNLPFLRPIDFTQFESLEYQTLRQQRTIAEYCWTVNPINPYLVFLADSSVMQVTYLDADMWFLHSPKAVFDEFANSQKAVLITEHAYLPQYDQTATSGKYCAQWITYRRHQSEPLRKWWEDKCYEWCFNRYEDGKFGDQKYLEQWPIIYPNQVQVFSQPRQFLAPWNADDALISNAVTYHFHGLRILDQNHFSLRSTYHVSQQVQDLIYQPYLQDLRRAALQMQSIGIPLLSQMEGSWEKQRDQARLFLMQQLANAAQLRVEQFSFM